MSLTTFVSVSYKSTVIVYNKLLSVVLVHNVRTYIQLYILYVQNWRKVLGRGKKYFFKNIFLWPQEEVPLSALRFYSILVHTQWLCLSSEVSTARYAGSELGTTVSVAWIATNEPPHLQKNYCYILFKETVSRDFPPLFFLLKHTMWALCSLAETV